jgi:uncharacterized lipoprotein YmbA
VGLRCRIALALGAALLAACASSPVTLVVLPAPAPEASAAHEDAGPTVWLRAVTLPAYLDAFPVVLGRADGTLVVSQKVEWAERLPEAATRVLRDALSQRLGAARVLIARDGRIPDGELTIEFLALDPVGGKLNLDARWFFSCRVRTQSRGGRTHLEMPLARAAADAVAFATTAALNRFADELATQLPCGRIRGDTRNASGEQTS